MNPVEVRNQYYPDMSMQEFVNRVSQKARAMGKSVGDFIADRMKNTSELGAEMTPAELAHENALASEAPKEGVESNPFVDPSLMLAFATTAPQIAKLAAMGGKAAVKGGAKAVSKMLDRPAKKKMLSIMNPVEKELFIDQPSSIMLKQKIKDMIGSRHGTANYLLKKYNETGNEALLWQAKEIKEEALRNSFGLLDNLNDNPKLYNQALSWMDEAVQAKKSFIPDKFGMLRYRLEQMGHAMPPKINMPMK